MCLVSEDLVVMQVGSKQRSEHNLLRWHWHQKAMVVTAHVVASKVSQRLRCFLRRCKCWIVTGNLRAWKEEEGVDDAAPFTVHVRQVFPSHEALLIVCQSLRPISHKVSVTLLT